jgi:uncharacterized protein YdiU (UPF0061 family)
LNSIHFKNRYVTLGKKFYVKTLPSPVSNPALIKLNDDLTTLLSLPDDLFHSTTGTAILSGNLIPEGAQPLAMAYAGHQFGHFNPQLGDGRALHLGEITDPQHNTFDIQLKGSGRTPYSRNGDGRAALGPILREYLISEAMVKLGVPTTRALAIVTTGEDVMRERRLPGGIITRIATSFVRIGTFEYFAEKGDIESLRKLADYVIERNYPQVGDTHNPYASLLKAIVDSQAALIAKWMQLGFIHGVMNTDNVSVAGETIDYGPCAFMDNYDHDRVFSSIDREGRYAYSNQPNIGLWNLTRLAETLVPLLAENTEAAVDIAKDILQRYYPSFDSHWLAAMRAKIGVSENANGSSKDDKVLVDNLLNIMATNQVDFTLSFFHLSQLSKQASKQDNNLRRLFANPEAFDDWSIAWRKRLEHETQSDAERQTAMRHVNPVYIPRNHQIETVIRAGEDYGDFAAFHALHKVLQNPYTQQEGKESYQRPPKPEEVVTQTFCGT